MTIRKPGELIKALGRNARVLGLDLGTRTVGLALSDVGRTIATPYDTIKRTKLAADLARLEEIIAKEGVGALVLGLPINMDGSEGPRAQSTRAFARNLAARNPTARGAPPILLWDERLSTVAVERALLEADASRKRRAEVVDKMAAAYILQGALDRLAHVKRDRMMDDRSWEDRS